MTTFRFRTLLPVLAFAFAGASFAAELSVPTDQASPTSAPAAEQPAQLDPVTLTAEQKRGILCGNVAELYGIDLRGLEATS